MQRVLVTGATGFIGKHSLPLLLNKGFEVHAVSSKKINPKNNCYIWHQADLTKTDQIKSLVKKLSPSHLLHFAWHTKPKSYWTSHENLKWLQASLTLLQTFQSSGGKRALFAGTCAEYEWKHQAYVESTTPLIPSSLYGVCKHSLQEILYSYSKENKLSSAWGRIFFLFGPGEHQDRLVSFVIKSLLNNKITPCSEGTQLRDFLYVEDVASAFVAILESDIEGPINIGSGKGVAIQSLVKMICEKMDKQDLVRFGEISTSSIEPQKLVADITRLTKEVKWLPKHNLNTGIEKTIQWLQKAD